eukprot:scaffold699_cov385-Prasinococcus_capsulatus_cf.AAC.7
MSPFAKPVATTAVPEAPGAASSGVSSDNGSGRPSRVKFHGVPCSADDEARQAADASAKLPTNALRSRMPFRLVSSLFREYSATSIDDSLGGNAAQDDQAELGPVDENEYRKWKRRESMKQAQGESIVRRPHSTAQRPAMGMQSETPPLGLECVAPPCRTAGCGGVPGGQVPATIRAADVQATQGARPGGVLERRSRRKVR